MPVGFRTVEVTSAATSPGEASRRGGGGKSGREQSHGFNEVYSEWQFGQTMGIASDIYNETMGLRAGREIQNFVGRD